MFNVIRRTEVVYVKNPLEIHANVYLGIAIAFFLYSLWRLFRVYNEPMIKNWIYLANTKYLKQTTLIMYGYITFFFIFMLPINQEFPIRKYVLTCVFDIYSFIWVVFFMVILYRRSLDTLIKK